MSCFSARFQQCGVLAATRQENRSPDTCRTCCSAWRSLEGKEYFYSATCLPRVHHQLAVHVILTPMELYTFFILCERLSRENALACRFFFISNVDIDIEYWFLFKTPQELFFAYFLHIPIGRIGIL